MVKNGLYIDLGGHKWWYRNNLFHRLNGPSIIYVFGDKRWYQNNNLHRLDGPARIFSNGHKEWFYRGKKINCSTQAEFERLIKLRLLW